MDIPLKANVHCTDGRAGQATCVIINPVSRQLTHVVVEEKDPAHLKRLVPVELITVSDRHNIHLDCTTAQLATLRPFMEIEYPRDGALYFTYESDEVRNWPYETVVEMPIPAELERILPEALTIHQDSRVEATDGRVGKVERLLINPTNKSLISIAIETGYFWKRQELIVSMAHVDHFDKDRIALNLDKHHLKRLAAVQSQESYI